MTAIEITGFDALGRYVGFARRTKMPSRGERWEVYRRGGYIPDVEVTRGPANAKRILKCWGAVGFEHSEEEADASLDDDAIVGDLTELALSKAG